MPKLIPVTKERPCPVCGGDHKCAYNTTGLFLCGRKTGEQHGFHYKGRAKNPTWSIYRAETPLDYLGGTDALALAHLGLDAIGRPSANVGGAMLTALLAEQKSDRPIVCLAVNDRKPDVHWPGRDGRRRCRRRIRRQSGRDRGAQKVPARTPRLGDASIGAATERNNCNTISDTI